MQNQNNQNQQNFEALTIFRDVTIHKNIFCSHLVVKSGITMIQDPESTITTESVEIEPNGSISNAHLIITGENAIDFE